METLQCISVSRTCQARKSKNLREKKTLYRVFSGHCTCLCICKNLKIDICTHVQALHPPKDYFENLPPQKSGWRPLPPELNTQQLVSIPHIFLCLFDGWAKSPMIYWSSRDHHGRKQKATFNDYKLTESDLVVA